MYPSGELSRALPNLTMPKYHLSVIVGYVAMEISITRMPVSLQKQ